MRFTIFTLFPDFIEAGLHSSILGKASDKGLLSFKTVNIRDYSADKNNRVDDYTYGGGAGMLMQAQPVFDAYNSVYGKSDKSDRKSKKIRTIYVTPQGRPFDQCIANELACEDEIAFLCGHYEGIDERVLEEIVTDRYSIGDYVLTGGELPALVMIDAISRLVPGVLGNDASSEIESFYGNLLEYPQYTRPENWEGKVVPSVLLNGNPKDVDAWRKAKQIELTKKVRPDLFDKYELRNSVLSELKKDKRNYIHIYEALRRGFGEIISTEPLMVYIPSSKMLYFADIKSMKKRLTSYSASEIINLIPDNIDLVVAEDAVANTIASGGGYEDSCPVYNAVYTENVHKKIKNKDIRKLTLDNLAYVNEHYTHGNDGYNKDRINRGLMYGIYDNDTLCGFIGTHGEGSIGMLFVDEAYRGKGYASDLESFMINRELEKGNIPYGQVIIDNEASYALQKKLGLYLGDKIMTWLHIK